MDLAQLYTDGLSTTAIAAQAGLSAQYVRQKLRESGVKLDRSSGLREAYASGRRSAADRAEKVRRYTVDHEVFEKPLTPATAWVLGVIIGDGCIVRRRGQVYGLEVCGDEDVCRKVAAILGSNSPVRHLKGGCYAVRIHSTRITDALARYGLGPAKTETVQIPEGISAELLPHLMRGYWDADGCVTQKNGRIVLASTTVSSKLANQVAAIATAVVGGKSGPYGKRKVLVALSCFKAVEFGDWLWADSTVSTRSDRKYARFIELRKEYLRFRGMSRRYGKVRSN